MISRRISFVLLLSSPVLAFVQMPEPEPVLRLGSEKFRHPHFLSDRFAAPGFTPDGKELITFTKESQYLRYWEPTTGKLLRQVRPEVEGTLEGVLFSPDCRWIATLETKRSAWFIVMREAATGKRVRTLEVPAGRDARFFIARFRFLPGGKEVLLVTANSYLIWDIATGRLLLERELDRSLAFNSVVAPDGTTLTCWDDAKKQLIYHDWTLDAGARQVPLAMPRSAHLIGYAPDGRFLFFNEYPGGILQIDATTHQILRRFEAPESKAYLLWVTLSPDGKRLYAVDRHVAEKEGSAGAVVWNVATGEVLHQLRTPGRAGNMTLSADGKYLAMNAPGLPLWDTTTGRRVNPDTPAERTHATRLVAGSTRWVTLDDGLAPHLWDAKTGRLLGLLDDDSSWVSGCDVSPDGRWIATAGTNGIQLFKGETGAAQGRFSSHRRSSSGVEVRFGSNSRELAYFGNDYRVHTLDLATGEALREVSFTPDGITEEQWKNPTVSLRYRETLRTLSRRGEFLLLSDFQNELKVFDATTGAVLYSLLEGRPLRDVVVDFSPGGRHLLLNCELRREAGEAEADENAPPPQRRYLYCLDTTTGEVLWKSPQAGAVSEGLHIAPDGKTFALAASHEDGRGTIERRSLADGSLLDQLKDLPMDRLQPAFLPDGKRLAIVRSDGVVEIHRLK